MFRKMLILVGVIGGMLAMAGFCLADTILVPGQYPTIQAGIEAAVNGDIVLVADGTYTGTGNKNIDFTGKEIVVMSENGPENCIIDCEDNGRGFNFHLHETLNAMLSGFTITNGLMEEGGGIYCSSSSPTISNCIIHGNCAEGQIASGGGIYCTSSDPTIENCNISENAANSEDKEAYGGGIHCYYSSPTIQNCSIEGNSCFASEVAYGGGIHCYFSNPTISRCTIRENTASAGGGIYGFHFSAGISYCVISENSECGMYLWWDSPTIENCTISGNSSAYGGSGVLFDGCSPTVVNTIVEGNTESGAIFFTGSPNALVTYGDFYNNEGGDFTGSPPLWLGQVVTVNANGDSCDTYSNIFYDPLFVDPGNGDFNLREGSPCIDAGDPTYPLDPDGTMADIGAFYFDQSALILVSLTPYNPPIVIPPGGDAFAYNIVGINYGSTSAIFDVWVNIEAPGGYQFTVLGPIYDLTLAAGNSIERDRTVFVPGSAPAGEYNCMGMIGTYPWIVIDSDEFAFIKEGADGIWEDSEGWIGSGESFPGELYCTEEAVPEELALQGAFPNPFNPTTAISYQLSALRFVNLSVYDVSGRKVAELVDGWREKGRHEVTSDASDLASGIYLAHLKAGDFSQVQKMVLVK